MVLAALAVILAPAASAMADIVYDRTIDTAGQHLGGNITNNVLITSDGSATDGGVPVKIYGGGLVTVQGDWDFRGQNNFLGGVGSLGTLHVDGGTATTDNSLIFNGCVSSGVVGESRLNVTGGTFNLVSAYANQNDSRLYVSQTGGFTNAAGTFTVGHGSTQKTNVQAQYVISGGRAKFGNLTVGNGGSSLTSANCGSGRFEVNGLWTVDGVAKAIEIASILRLHHTLAFNFGATGVTPIDAATFVLGTTDGANPTIELGVLDGLTAGDVAAGTYDLVRLADAWDGSLGDIALVAPTGWALQMSDDGTAIQAVVPVIPEPSTMALLGFGGIMFLSRRWRK